MPTEENKALACMEIEKIWTKGNLAAVKGTGRSYIGVDRAGR
jgi:hypothetical protein